MSLFWPISRLQPGYCTINRKSNQFPGLLYWFSPIIDKHPSLADPFGLKHLNQAAFSLPGIQASELFGYAYRVGDSTSQAYVAKRISIDYITCSAWIKGGNQTAAANVIRGDDTNANRNFQFKIDTTVLSFIAFKRSGGFSIITGATLVNDNKWHHIAATLDGVVIRCYVDGKEDATPVAVPSLLNNTLGDSYMFGSIVDFYYVGLMGDARIYNRALSAAEIFQLYDPDTRWDLYDSNDRTIQYIVPQAPEPPEPPSPGGISTRKQQHLLKLKQPFI